jgi:hypothetical protein
MNPSTLLAAFASGDIEPAEFDHRRHVQVACEMLCAYPLLLSDATAQGAER